jgi:hypothetical protein
MGRVGGRKNGAFDDDASLVIAMKWRRLALHSQRALRQSQSNCRLGSTNRRSMWVGQVKGRGGADHINTNLTALIAVANARARFARYRVENALTKSGIARKALITKFQ